MSTERIEVDADSEDLELIAEASRRRGIPEGDIIREGIHLAAMPNRVWDEPLDWPTRGEPMTDGWAPGEGARSTEL
ncbi:CopG family transcriptional regulator [Kribbella sp. NPDC004536]|uniref:CopG family transcriptional regulator n=1 Tax=Kribbella sp. NPDC004536 TaxID=3364106 RepID=UPI00369E15DA